MNTAMQLAEQGKEYFNRLKFAEAEKFFLSALEADTNSIGARIGLARICILRKKISEGDRLVNDVLKLAPQDAEALALRGLLFMRNELWNEAINYFEKAREANAKLVMPCVNLARSYRKLGNLQAAEKAAREAIALSPKNAKARAELALALMKTKRVPAGIAEIVESIRVNPFYVRSYLALGRLYQMAGKTDLTIDIYRNGLKHNPQAIVLQEALAGVYAFKRDFPRAYKQAVLIATKRGTYRDWLRVGNCAVAIGQFQKAEKAFKKSLAVHSENWEAHYNLAELYFNAKLYEAAKQHYTRAIDLNNKSYKPLNGIGLLTLMAERNPVEAEKYFQRALKLAPKQKEPLLNMAIASADRKVYAEAAQFAQATLRAARPGDGLYEQAEQLIIQIQNEKRSGGE